MSASVVFGNIWFVVSRILFNMSSTFTIIR